MGDRPDFSPTLGLEQAAALLRMHPHTLEKRARAGEVPGTKAGKCWVFIQIDLLDWLRSQYRTKQEGKCRSTDEVASGIVSGKSKASELEKRLAQRTGKPRRSTTTAAVLPFGGKRS